MSFRGHAIGITSCVGHAPFRCTRTDTLFKGHARGRIRFRCHTRTHTLLKGYDKGQALLIGHDRGSILIRGYIRCHTPFRGHTPTLDYRRGR